MAGSSLFRTVAHCFRTIVPVVIDLIPCGQNIRVRERVYDGCSSCQRTKWLGCWPTSPGWSIRNSCSRMNTSQPRIASSEPNFPPVCVFRIPHDQPLLRSVSDSAVLRFSRLPVWPSPIPSRRLIARKFDGSKLRTSPGRPRIASDLEALIVRFARENSGWGYDRIVGALANLGHAVSDQTVAQPGGTRRPLGNILRRYGIQPAPKRSQNTTWK